MKIFIFKLTKLIDNIKKNMSLFYQTVISIISKPSEKRKDEEILMILAWFINLFKKKAHVFGDVNSG